MRNLDRVIVMEKKKRSPLHKQEKDRKDSNQGSRIIAYSSSHGDLSTSAIEFSYHQ